LVESSGVSNTFKSSKSPAEICKAWAEGPEEASVLVELVGSALCAHTGKTPATISKKRNTTESRNIVILGSSGYVFIAWTAEAATASFVVVFGGIRIVKFGMFDGVSHNAENVGP
jgi:hypothetical protein